MLDWFKLTAAIFPPKQLLQNKNPTTATDDTVKRLVRRLDTHHETVADEPPAVCSAPLIEAESRALPTQQMTETLMSRIDGLRRAPNELGGRSPGMLTIAIASQKGGAGKTTIAAHLAVQAAIEGLRPVVLVDTDPQGSLSEWWAARNDGPLANHDNAMTLATMTLNDLTTARVGLHGHGAAVTIIDTPPALTTSIEQVIEIADFIIVPARPSPHDLRAIGATVGMIQRARKPFLFVVNGAAPRANITAEAVAALSEHGRVAPVILYQRTNFAGSMIDGRTVMEVEPSSRSAQEIALLWKHVYEHIGARAAA